MALFNFGKNAGAPAAGGANVPVSQVLAMKAQGLNSNQIANQLRVGGYSLTQIRDALAQADIKSAVVPGMESAPGGVIPGGAGMDMGMPDMNMPDMNMGMPDMNMPAMPDMNMGMPDMGNMPGMQMQGNQGMPQDMEMPPLPSVSQQSPVFQQQQPQMMQQQPQQMSGMQMGPMPGQRPFSIEQLVNELQRVIEEIIEEKWTGVEDKLNALDMWKVKVESKVDELSSRVTELNARIDEFSKGMVKKTEDYQSTMEEVGTEMEAVEKLMGKLVPSLAEEIKELRNVVDKLKKH